MSFNTPRYEDILADMVEAGELTPQEAADEWREHHADDERDSDR